MKNGLKIPLSTEFCKDGIDLSGYKKQKVTIMRMFCCNGYVLILHASYCALDMCRRQGVGG